MNSDPQSFSHYSNATTTGCINNPTIRGKASIVAVYMQVAILVLSISPRLATLPNGVSVRDGYIMVFMHLN